MEYLQLELSLSNAPFLTGKCWITVAQCHLQGPYPVMSQCLSVQVSYL